MLKAILSFANSALTTNATGTRPVAIPANVDGNGIPYSLLHSGLCLVDVYNYVVTVSYEVRKYTSPDGTEFAKVSYIAEGQLPLGDNVIPQILVDRYRVDVTTVQVEDLIAADVERMCYKVTTKDGRFAIAPLRLLGSFGAKNNKDGKPVMFVECLVDLERDVAAAKVGDVMKVRVLYIVGSFETYINAYPQVKTDPASLLASAVTERKDLKVSLIEKPYSSVDFLTDNLNIHTQVLALVKANF